MQVILDGLALNYHDTGGDGKVLLMLHGWGDSSQGFGNLAKALSGSYRVIVPDLPGFGFSESASSITHINSWGLTEYAEFLGQFLKKINIDKLYAVIGHSNGGSIAIRGLSQNIISAEKLILLASAGIRNTNKGRLKVLRLVTKTGKVVSYPLPSPVRKKLRAQLYKTIGSDLLVKDDMQGSFKKIISDDVQRDAEELNLPTLLLYGEQDPITPPSYGIIFHELINGSELDIIPGAKHFLFLDQPEVVNKTIKEFLK